MDKWLTHMEADSRDVPLAQKVLDDKPADAVDACFTGPYGASTEVTNPATCAADFPYYGDARLGAGAPLVDNAMQCTLKPLDASDYSVSFTAEAAHPGGVAVAADWAASMYGCAVLSESLAHTM